MKRNLNLIVTRVGSHYDLMMPEPLQSPKLYVSTRPYAGEETFLCDVEGNNLVIADPTPGSRPYFTLKQEGAPDTTAADRTVDLGGVENCRDMGGYLTADGRTVKWGRFFRGGALALSKMDEDALRRCDVLGLRSILDYRDDAEAEKAPDHVPEGAEHHHQPAINSTVLAGRIRRGNKADLAGTIGMVSTVTSQEDSDLFYEQFKMLYQAMPFGNPAYKVMFDALDREETVPLYQHCSAGKDRTGVGCFLLLTALGVDIPTAMGDYLLSRPYREAFNRDYMERHSQNLPNEFARRLMRRMFTVEAELLQSSLDAIFRKYPDLGTFFREEYGVTAERAAHWRSLHLA